MEISGSIAILATLVALLIVLGVYQSAGIGAALAVAAVIAALMTAQHVAASSGLLKQWDRRPPPILPLVVASIALTIMLAFSRVGSAMAGNLSFATLIVSQMFRLPLELTMHHAAALGVMPIQMSYSGCNFDIITGATAGFLAVAAGFGQAPRWLLIGWNALGSFLLLAIIFIAVISMPTFAAFGPERLNTWIADPPFIWLPGVLVPGALLGHLLVWRKLFPGPSN
ncbi:MAG TPA: hypothetical protein VM120_00635 [Bryobacteraceae bacterium]|nr:hypothetical protein [Bryobacteraceae bacterium]